MFASWLFVASCSICKSCSNYPLLLKFARIIFHNFSSTLTPFSCALFPCATPCLLLDHLLLLQFASLVLIILFSCTWIKKRLSPLSLSCHSCFFFWGKAMEISLHNFLLLLCCGNWGSFSAPLPFPALSKRQSNGSLSLLIIFVLFSFILIEEGLELLSSFITLSLDKAMSKSTLDNFPLLLCVNWRMLCASLPSNIFSLQSNGILSS